MRQHERPMRSEIWTVLETVGLADRADDKAQTYSFGMKQRLVLAQALLPMPALLVFDEPTDGLDPIAVVELRGLHFFIELRPYLFTTYIGYWRGLFREQVVWSDLLQDGGKMLAFTFAFLSIAYHRFRIRQEI